MLNHDLLWKKLLTLGLSAKSVNLLRNLYVHAAFTVSVGSERTREFDLSSGVLQGDVTSPLLFSLFISDFEDFLKARNLPGVTIDSRHEINALFYADDLVLFSDSSITMNKLLSALKDYCDENALQVNSAKTKVLVCQRGGPRPKYSFFYDGAAVEVVNRFNYLGVSFATSGKFNQNADEAVRRGEQACHAILRVVNQGRAGSLETWKKLFGGLIASTTLYGSEVFGLNHLEKLERAQVRCFKLVLYLAKNTPDHYVRWELGLSHLAVDILRRAMNWWEKLLKMEDNRCSGLVMCATAD
ncbi:Reverse transcriptase (RNA-dependent DNA polymerase) [Nesidiocoris tenuis]|uniref:Reverse transcriptase (RNA-dependent DNA polymerase) n=1 Tax=Nesidiocoris tenuis TaxID=355587 RepID=A0ABN7AIG3_9HEMI|nr:Reverse transcriptase (RNA-dependent DNA polymerase) [Nesidiocoris tenuis]